MLNQAATQIAESTGGVAKGRPPKDPIRAMDKIQNKYDGFASRLTDLAGAAINYPSIGDAYKALDVFRQRPDLKIVFFDDRFTNPEGSGYRDLQLKGKMPNGHVSELRLQADPIDSVAADEHSIYEVQREIASYAANQHGDMTPGEQALRAALRMQVLQLYEQATQKALR